VREVIERACAQEVIETACKLWPHHSDSSLGALKAFLEVPSPALVAGLMTEANLSEEQEVGRLSETWYHIGKFSTSEHYRQTAIQILSTRAKGTEGEPDMALHLWLDVRQEYRAELFSDLLTSEELNDEQRRRVWLQVERVHSELGKEFFIGILPKVLTSSDSVETVRGVFESEKIITKLFNSTADRYLLGKALVQAFLGAPSLETKNRAAGWIVRADAGAALRELEGLGSPTEEDLNILKEHFRGSRYLDKLVRRRSKEAPREES